MEFISPFRSLDQAPAARTSRRRSRAHSGNSFGSDERNLPTHQMTRTPAIVLCASHLAAAKVCNGSSPSIPRRLRLVRSAPSTHRESGHRGWAAWCLPGADFPLGSVHPCSPGTARTTAEMRSEQQMTTRSAHSCGWATAHKLYHHPPLARSLGYGSCDRFQPALRQSSCCCP
jgi:hypothetical protein